ncbi:unnamed protein product [Peniophora sp. CBMAI 1063]|nr:unnamed protein product [Peniophora sp. CBMAI 1063]
MSSPPQSEWEEDSQPSADWGSWGNPQAHIPWGSSSKAPSGPELFDGLYAADPRDIASLDHNLFRMVAVEHIIIDTKLYLIEHGAMIVRQLVTNNTRELKQPHAAVTCPRLQNITLSVRGKRSARMYGTLWTELEDLTSIRSVLASDGRCVRMKCLTLEGNICICKKPLLDAHILKRFQSTIATVTLDVPDGGCQNCA